MHIHWNPFAIPPQAPKEPEEKVPPKRPFVLDETSEDAVAAVADQGSDEDAEQRRPKQRRQEPATTSEKPRPGRKVNITC